MKELFDFILTVIERYGLLGLGFVVLLYLLHRVINSNNKKVDADSKSVESENKKDDTLSELAKGNGAEVIKFANRVIDQAEIIGEQGKEIATLRAQMLEFDAAQRGLERELKRTHDSLLESNRSLVAVNKKMLTYETELANYKDKDKDNTDEKASLRAELNEVKQENVNLKQEMATLRETVANQAIEIESLRKGAVPTQVVQVNNLLAPEVAPTE